MTVALFGRLSQVPGGIMIRIALALLAILFATACTSEDDPVPPAPVMFDLSDEDFGGFPAKATLEAIGSFSESADSPVSVGFLIDGAPLVFVFSTGELFSRLGISIDTPHFNVGYDRLTFDDEEVSLEEVARRIEVYAEAARLTDSRPAFRLSASSGAENSDLVDLLERIAAEGIVELVTEPGKRGATAKLPPPQAVAPYEIQGSDLFPAGTR